MEAIYRLSWRDAINEYSNAGKTIWVIMLTDPKSDHNKTKPLDGYLKFLRKSEVAFSLSEFLHKENDQEGNEIPPGLSPHTYKLPSGRVIIEHFDRDAGLGADHATVSVAKELDQMGDVLGGKIVIEIGCGTGVLAMVASSYGAKVIGTDICQRSINYAQKNSKENDIPVEFLLGSLLNPVKNNQQVDLFIANLPHKPCSSTHALSLAHAGGLEGDHHFINVLPECVRRQSTGGQLIFFMHSLPNPQLLKAISKNYTLEIRSWKLRWKHPEESSQNWRHYQSRHGNELSYLHIEDDRKAMVCCVWLCTRK